MRDQSERVINTLSTFVQRRIRLQRAIRSVPSPQLNKWLKYNAKEYSCAIQIIIYAYALCTYLCPAVCKANDAGSPGEPEPITFILAFAIDPRFRFGSLV